MSQVSYTSEAYQNRQEGYSPEFIRDSLWEIVKNDVSGVVLDVGSGNGGWIKRLQKNKNIKRMLSVDIVDDGASKISGVEFFLGDLSKDQLKIPEKSVDWVFAVEVMEHLANPRHFVSQASRILKPGGKLVITTPNNESLRAKMAFFLRGEFPAFCEHDYKVAGHIMPIFEYDLKRMGNEVGLNNYESHFNSPGSIPKLAMTWQSIFPFLRGKLWSDGLTAILTKN